PPQQTGRFGARLRRAMVQMRADEPQSPAGPQVCDIDEGRDPPVRGAPAAARLLRGEREPPRRTGLEADPPAIVEDGAELPGIAAVPPLAGPGVPVVQTGDELLKLVVYALLGGDERRQLLVDHRLR